MYVFMWDTSESPHVFLHGLAQRQNASWTQQEESTIQETLRDLCLTLSPFCILLSPPTLWIYGGASKRQDC